MKMYATITPTGSATLHNPPITKLVRDYLNECIPTLIENIQTDVKRTGSPTLAERRAIAELDRVMLLLDISTDLQRPATEIEKALIFAFSEKAIGDTIGTCRRPGSFKDYWRFA